jgi:transposase
VRTAAAFAPGNGKPTTPEAATRLALCTLAERYQQLDAQIRPLTKQLDRLTLAHAPTLRARPGIGPDSAAALLITEVPPLSRRLSNLVHLGQGGSHRWQHPASTHPS